MKRNIIIDTDCGMDDIIAITMIVSSGKFNIIGVTTVRGLVTPTIGKKNLSKVFRYLNSNIEIVSGSNSPLNENRKNYSFPKQDKINSTKLLCLKDLLKPIKTKRQTYSASEFLFKKVNSSEDKTALFCIGPLTNIAKAIQKYKSKFIRKIDQIIIMGGAIFTPGNVPPSRTAEYNIFLDPEAAEIVFSSGVPIKLVSLDATKFVPATNDLKLKIERLKTKNKYGQIIKRIITANKNDFDYFYDPLAAGILIDPKIVLQTEEVDIEILKSRQNAGQTIATQKSEGVEIVTKVDTNKFINLLFKTIK